MKKSKKNGRGKSVSDIELFELGLKKYFKEMMEKTEELPSDGGISVRFLGIFATELLAKVYGTTLLIGCVPIPIEEFKRVYPEVYQEIINKAIERKKTE